MKLRIAVQSKGRLNEDTMELLKDIASIYEMETLYQGMFTISISALIY